jgi:hypothetical protein
MGQVTITFVDAPDGAVRVDITFDPPLEPTDPRTPAQSWAINTMHTVNKQLRDLAYTEPDTTVDALTAAAEGGPA